MTAAPATDIPIAFAECCITIIVIALAFAFPRLGNGWLGQIERMFASLARRRGWAVAVVGVAALLLRLAILPFVPIPLPFVPDDFSFLLAADTFVHGRLANPVPAMWHSFESIHITVSPTYMSMYFPAQGLVLAAGKVLFGHPWFGILFVTASMCATICWMLQAWMPPTWALLGGLLAVLRLGLFSYWINTYGGAGSVAALGGALALGAMPRILRNTRKRDCLLLAIGIVLLLLSRPYEGMLVCLPILAALVYWLLSRKQRLSAWTLVGRAALPLALIASAFAWLGYYDLKAFGNPLILPYTVDRATYAVAPYWIWESPKPEPTYRYQVLRDFYVRGEGTVAADYRAHVIFHSLGKGLLTIRFFSGIALLPCLFFLPRAILDRRSRFFLRSALLWIPAVVIVVFLIPHYLAPFTCVFYFLGLQSMRHLRAWKRTSSASGKALVRFTVVSCLVLAAMRCLAAPLHLGLSGWPGSTWAWDWYGPGHFGTERAALADELRRLPGKQLAIVRYAPGHEAINEWVYNDADIENSKVIWARESTAPDERALLNAYKDRTAWLIQPDTTPVGISPYPWETDTTNSASPRNPIR